MNISSFYNLRYNADRPTRFHDLQKVSKARMYANNAAKAAKEGNLELAEWFLNAIKFQHEVGRKELNIHRASGSAEETVRSVSGAIKQIEHIHNKCAQEIKASWQLPSDKAAQVQILQDLKKDNPGHESEIDILISALGEPTEWHEFKPIGLSKHEKWLIALYLGDFENWRW